MFGSSVVSATVNTSITSSFQNYVIQASNTITLSLLAAASAQEGFLFSVKNVGTGVITIDPNAAETIDGLASVTLAPEQWALIVCDGTSWVTLSYAFPYSNNTATTAPAVTDDSSDGYTIGSNWYDVTADEAYRCVDATVGAAVWLNTTLTIDDLGAAATKGFIDDDTFATATDDTAASSESIKAYVDANKFAINEGTEQATTSGTSFDFTGIPTGTKRVTVKFSGVSMNGTDEMLVQIGDSGGIEATGYDSGSSILGSGVASVTSTTGFIINSQAASNVVMGSLVIERMNGTGLDWVASGCFGSATGSIVAGGTKSLSAELDRVRLTRAGAQTFDAGSVNISYE